MHGVCWAPGYSVEHADILAALAMLRAEQREALILVEAIRFFVRRSGKQVQELGRRREGRPCPSS
jgi:hypothetical protein